jgi:hypothetical protein
VYAHRPFAGGRYTIIPGYLSSSDDRQFMLERISKEVVPFVVVTSRSKDVVWAAYPELARYIGERFEPLVTYRFGADQNVIVDVLVSRTLVPRRPDSITGWPCFR